MGATRAASSIICVYARICLRAESETAPGCREWKRANYMCTPTAIRYTVRRVPLKPDGVFWLTGWICLLDCDAAAGCIDECVGGWVSSGYLTLQVMLQLAVLTSTIHGT